MEPGPGASGHAQGSLLDVPAPAERAVEGAGVVDPVARVLLDSPVPHLDRTFDYLVPPELDVAAAVGTRVTVRLGAQEMHGWVWERGATTTHAGRLAPLRRVVSDLPVLTASTRRLVQAVAERTAGTRSDVVRLALPPRHATTERSERDKPTPRLPRWTMPAMVHGPADPADPTAPTLPHAGAATQPTPTWDAYDGGAAFLGSLAQGRAPRAVWQALPGRDGLVGEWTALLAEAARAALSRGRGVLVVLATTDQARTVARELEAALGEEPVVVLSAEDGPARRYRAFLRLLLGHARVVVGTRAAAFAPVGELGLAVVWDDGDDRLDERHAPYVHARTVLALRSALEGAGLLIASRSRSVESQAYVAQGWATDLRAPRATVRAAVPRIEAPDELELEAEGPSGRGRIPSLAHRAVRDAVRTGPVLVQVPRGGYAPSVACASCRAAGRCTRCAGPLSLGRSGPASCRWCGRGAEGWTCPRCGSHELRMVSVGSARTGEELGRSFPGVPVVVSGARESHGVIAQVDASPRLVVATPGAEPVAEGGYRAVLLLDGAALSGRADLGATGEALRRWSNAVCLAAADARVMLLGHPDRGVAQSLLRWDQAGRAALELTERAELHLPPTWRTARLDGPAREVGAVLEDCARAGFEALGPTPVDGARLPDAARGLVRAPLDRGRELARYLRGRLRERSAHREAPLRIELDPTVLW